jgi:hypothetical protein
VIPLLVALTLWPSWQTVAQGASSAGACELRSKVFVAGTFRAAVAFIPCLRDEDQAAVARVHFTSVVLVAALSTTPTPCYRLEIVDLRRYKQTLTVDAVVRPPPADIGCIFTVGRPYHVIAVPRLLIGRPLPQRVVFNERRLPPAP